MTRLILALLVTLTAAKSLALDSFSADYQLLVNGEKKGETHFNLQIKETGYSFEAFTEPTEQKGAREVIETSHGHFDGTRPEPDSYYYALRSETGTQMVELFFDWKNRLTTARGPDDKQSFGLEEGTQDRLSYLLRAMALADSARFDAEFPRISIEGVEKTKLNKKTRRYISTPGGRYLAQEISITNGNSGQSRTLWLAVKKGYLPLALEQQTEEGVVRMELIRIVSK